MALLRGLALFLLCLVGYSGAVVATARDGRPRPGAWELLVTGLAGIAAATTAPGLVGHWAAFPVAVATGAAPGALAGLVRRTASADARRDRDGSGPLLRQPQDGVPPDLESVRGFLLRLGDFQGRVTMGYLYFLLLAPFAAVSRLGGDPFTPEPDGDTYWSDRDDAPAAEEDEPMTRQY